MRAALAAAPPGGSTRAAALTSQRTTTITRPAAAAAVAERRWPCRRRRPLPIAPRATPPSSDGLPAASTSRLGDDDSFIVDDDAEDEQDLLLLRSPSSSSSSSGEDTEDAAVSALAAADAAAQKAATPSPSSAGGGLTTAEEELDVELEATGAAPHSPRLAARNPYASSSSSAAGVVAPLPPPPPGSAAALALAQQLQQPPSQPGTPELEALLEEAASGTHPLPDMDRLARLFPFPLDPFQTKAVRHLLDGRRSVVVCAPTGAGKTAIAEAAAAYTLARGQRVVYTTPLKALSNQKLQEARGFFGTGRCGLQTGDTSINADAEVVVMTTEILRNIIYRAAEDGGEDEEEEGGELAGDEQGFEEDGEGEAGRRSSGKARRPRGVPAAFVVDVPGAPAAQAAEAAARAAAVAEASAGGAGAAPADAEQAAAAAALMSGAANAAAAAAAAAQQAAERLSRVGLVVLDEVHYLGDPNRGSVWEEIIINCPPHVQILAMSATVKNPDDLGGWMARERGGCATVKTRFRPVPLRWYFAYGDPRAPGGASNGGGRGGAGASLLAPAAYSRFGEDEAQEPAGRGGRRRAGVGRSGGGRGGGRGDGGAGSAGSGAVAVSLAPLLDASGKGLNPRLSVRESLMNEALAALSDAGREVTNPADVPAFDAELSRYVRRQLAPGALRRRAAERVPPQTAVVRRLRALDMLPAVWFILSRRDCDQSAQRVGAALDLLEPFIPAAAAASGNDDQPAAAAAAAAAALEAALARAEASRQAIADEVATLRREQPEAVREPLVPALHRGVAAHHAGCLPGWKALVERLFQRGHVRLVFATGTLAAGLNMPARTAIVSALARRTDDGIRPLPHNELLQMAGRAGRRGFDSVGNAVVLQTRWEGAEEAFAILAAGPEPLASQFAASYTMVLNLLTCYSLEGARAFLARSFGHYLSGAGSTKRLRAAEALEAEAARLAQAHRASEAGESRELARRARDERVALRRLREQAQEQRVERALAALLPTASARQQQQQPSSGADASSSSSSSSHSSIEPVTVPAVAADGTAGACHFPHAPRLVLLNLARRSGDPPQLVPALALGGEDAAPPPAAGGFGGGNGGDNGGGGASSGGSAGSLPARPPYFRCLSLDNRLLSVSVVHVVGIAADPGAETAAVRLVAAAGDGGGADQNKSLLAAAREAWATAAGPGGGSPPPSAGWANHAPKSSPSCRTHPGTALTARAALELSRAHSQLSCFAAVDPDGAAAAAVQAQRARAKAALRALEEARAKEAAAEAERDRAEAAGRRARGGGGLEPSSPGDALAAARKLLRRAERLRGDLQIATQGTWRAFTDVMAVLLEVGAMEWVDVPASKAAVAAAAALAPPTAAAALATATADNTDDLPPGGVTSLAARAADPSRPPPPGFARRLRVLPLGLAARALQGQNELWLATALTHPAAAELAPAELASLVGALLCAETVKLRTSAAPSPGGAPGGNGGPGGAGGLWGGGGGGDGGLLPPPSEEDGAAGSLSGAAADTPMGPSAPVVRVLEQLEPARQRLFDLQAGCGLLKWNDPLSVDLRLAGLVEAWASGCSWDEVMAGVRGDGGYGLDDGDVARLLARTSDLLRQVVHAGEGALLPHLRATARAALKGMDRPPVSDFTM